MSVSIQNNIIVTTDSNEVFVNGEKISIPEGMKTNSQTIINGRLFISGYEFFPKQKEFKRTLRAIWEYLF